MKNGFVAPTDRINKGKKDFPIQAIAITGGKFVPSRRYRINALIKFLSERGINLDEICPMVNSYPTSIQLLRLPWFAAVLAERASFLYRSRGYDLVILQRELISTLSTLECLLPTPKIFDVDDAIYLHRGGSAARHISKCCSLVVCGNNHLGEVFSQWNKNIVIIPTGVDTDQLRPINNKHTGKKIIGWIGTSGNYRYLRCIEPALTKVLRNNPTARLQIISNRMPDFLLHLGDQLDYISWRPNIENEVVPLFSVGIMPLENDEWARGKCAFKMLQYMAAGVPVVASPVGANLEILRDHDVGIKAHTQAEWVEAINVILRHTNFAYRMGKNARTLVEEKYSLRVVAAKWRDAMEGLI